ncbi:hypothetical protein pb186bvf_017765 [Paramecium bursaria]
MSRYDQQKNETVKSLTLPTIKQEFNPAQSSVITMSELNTIKQHISIQENKQPKKIDNQRVWAQRIQQQRKIKEAEKYERFVKEEEERRRVDEIEEQYQQSLKVQQLQEANQKIFDTRADVRNLKSKMLLSEIEKTNDQLKEINKNYAEMKSTLDLGYEREIKYRLDMKEFEEQEKIANHKALVQQNGEDLQKQHKDVRERLIKDYIKDLQEGKLIQQKAVEEEQQKEQKQQELRKKQLKLLKEHHDFLELRKKLQQQQLDLEEKEEKLRLDYENQKKNQMEMRKERESQNLQKKLLMRSQMYDIRLQQIQQQEDDYLERIQKVQEEKIKKEDELIQLKEQERKFLIKEAEESRKAQIEFKTKLRQSQQEDKQREHNQKIRAINNITELERSQQDVLKKRNKDLQLYQLQQIEQKAQKRRQQMMLDIKEYQQIRQYEDSDKKTFNSWAQQCIEEWRDTGKSVLPLVQSLYKD